jgi:hypothetical protein
MPVFVQSALSLREVVSRQFKGPGTVNISTVDVKAVTLRRVASFVAPFSVLCSPSTATTALASSSITSPQITAIVSGGRGPYSYAWSITSYTGATPPFISAPLLATTDFTQSGLSPNDLVTVVAQCVATDFYGSTANAGATLRFRYIDFS